MLPDGLVCDVYAERLGDGLVVEVETGFTPPSNALDPLDYLRARLAAKIARYSKYAGKMALAVPPYYAAPVPSILLYPPRTRERSELERLKSLVDRYYRDPPVSLEDLQLAQLHAVILVDVDRGEAVELDPEKHYETLGDIARRYSNRGLFIYTNYTSLNKMCLIM